MRVLKYVAVVLFVAAVPVFLVATNVRWVIATPLIYRYGFDEYNIPDRTGIERPELLSVGRQIRDYFNNGEEFLVVDTVLNGAPVRSLFNSREVLHMRDVKGLVRGVYRVQEIAGLYILAFAVVGLAMGRWGFVPRLARSVSLGGALTLGVVGLLNLASLVGFEALFRAFHVVSFSNDLWQLDPRTDYLIAIFPEEFFLDATLWIGGATVTAGLALTAVPLALMRWRGVPLRLTTLDG